MRPVGKLIAVEGLDGTGKSWLCSRMWDYFHEPHIRWRPRICSAISVGAPIVCDQIREILESPINEGKLHPDAEFALLAAARIQVHHETIMPELERGAVVISDRYHYSAYVYQRDAHGKFIEPEKVWSVLDAFDLLIEPDLTLLLDCDPEDRHRQPDGMSNRLEDRSDDEWVKMRDLYRRMAIDDPNARIIHAAQPKDDVWAEAKDYIDQSIIKGFDPCTAS